MRELIKRLNNLMEALKDAQTKVNELNTILGGFVTMYYVKNKLLFNEVDIMPASVSRLIYLATYLDYNDRENGLLVYKNKYIPLNINSNLEYVSLPILKYIGEWNKVGLEFSPPAYYELYDLRGSNMEKNMCLLMLSNTEVIQKN